MAKILISPATLAGIDSPYLDVLRQAGFELAFNPHGAQMTAEQLAPALKGASAVLAGSEPYTRQVIEANPGLKVIARVGVGYDAVDLAAATERGIAVTIAPGTNQDAVAEHTFALILALAKNLVTQCNEVHTGRWPRQANLPLRGRTLGIAGLGRIGKAVAVRGAAFGMKLLAYEPFPDRDFTQRYGIPLVSFDQLLQEADYLTLHVPLSAESKYLMCTKTLSRMKPTAFLINTARGGLVCEADVVKALKEHRIAGAGLDVFEEEPPGPGHALYGLPNVVLTPHAAGVDLQSRDDMALSSARSIVSLSRGQWPAEQVVNPEVRARFVW